MKTNIKVLTAVMAIAFFATSCKKEQNGGAEGQLPLNSAKASVTAVSSGTIYGHWANPRGGDYGNIYINLDNTTSLDTASAPNARFDIVLTGTNNSFVQGVNGYTVEYLWDNTITLAGIDNSTTGIAATSIGKSTTGAASAANGWYTYVAPGGNTLVNNFFIIARSNNPAKPDFALKFTFVDGDGTATLNRGRYIIDYGKIN